MRLQRPFPLAVAGRQILTPERSEPMVRPMTFLHRLVRLVTGNRQSASERAETDAEESARKYWQREVADEKERRGTHDPRRKE